MSPAPLLTVLVVTALLPGAGALQCQKGSIETVRDALELPLNWTAGQETCVVGQGCQDTLMIIENGHQVNMVIIKGCTAAENQEAQVTRHRAGPGLSVISYHHVCRHADFCNAVSTTKALGDLSTTTAPGTLRCPVCFSRGQPCPEDSREHICPAGYTHCYDGILKLRGGGIFSTLRVQGCLPRPGCNLLNGTQTIGVMDVSESCGPRSDALTCFQGVMLQSGSGFNQDPEEWSVNGKQTCNVGEMCQETLLLIDVGPSAILVGSKGCGVPGGQESQGVSIHSRPPGILVVSYSRFCSSNLCNNANSSSVLLSSLQRAPPVPGDVQCPACVQILGSCFSSSTLVTCPKSATHCYRGSFQMFGGGLSSPLTIQGCMAPNSTSLLNRTQNIGIFSVTESFENKEAKKAKNFQLNSAALAACLAPVLGLGLALGVMSFSLPANLISL
ncbi:PREDICTED: CD177 antigen [Dipodomys ordii]|uniref:CD177 antigen n=1 Tax=Dipodomys ordii TaxID=10020 RepID=A0A1S3GH17_DIPOR|nr:PREDICTED: CD177 antigen [Dipodomys ordii]